MLPNLECKLSPTFTGKISKTDVKSWFFNGGPPSQSKKWRSKKTSTSNRRAYMKSSQGLSFDLSTWNQQFLATDSLFQVDSFGNSLRIRIPWDSSPWKSTIWEPIFGSLVQSKLWIVANYPRFGTAGFGPLNHLVSRGDWRDWEGGPGSGCKKNGVVEVLARKWMAWNKWVIWGFNIFNPILIGVISPLITGN